MLVSEARFIALVGRLKGNFRMAIKRLHPGKRMSEGVVHGDRVILAGQVTDEANASKGIQDQARAVLGQIDALLAEAGTSKSNLLFAQVWLADMADFAGFNEIWDTWIDPANPPARACVQSAMVKPEWKVEVQVQAAL